MADLIPVREAASEFHVDRTTLHRHIREGRLHSYRRPMDKRTYVDRDELHALLTFRPVPQPKTDLARLEVAFAGFDRIHRSMRGNVDAVAIVREGRRELEERGA